MEIKAYTEAIQELSELIRECAKRIDAKDGGVELLVTTNPLEDEDYILHPQDHTNA